MREHTQVKQRMTDDALRLRGGLTQDMVHELVSCIERGGTLMEKLDKHDPHIADIFRKAHLEREQQDRRIADIFGTQKVPKVTEETLAIYLDYLKQHLEVPCQLTGIESRGCFAWEASYIFGRRRPKEYAQRKKKEPSYTDIYIFLSVEEEYDPYTGLAGKVKR